MLVEQAHRYKNLFIWMIIHSALALTASLDPDVSANVPVGMVNDGQRVQLSTRRNRRGNHALPTPVSHLCDVDVDSLDTALMGPDANSLCTTFQM